MRIVRTIAAVVAGVGIWGLLWNLGTQALAGGFPEAASTEPITSVVLLLTYVAYSVLVGVAAGWLAATIVGAEPMPTVWTLAVIQLGIGIWVQFVGFPDMFPLWYDLLFLAVVIPAHLFGGRLRAERAPSPAAA